MKTPTHDSHHYIVEAILKANKIICGSYNTWLDIERLQQLSKELKVNLLCAIESSAYSADPRSILRKEQK